MRLSQPSDHPDGRRGRRDARQVLRSDRARGHQDLERHRTAPEERDPENGRTRQTRPVRHGQNRRSGVQDQGDQEQGGSGLAGK